MVVIACDKCLALFQLVCNCVLSDKQVQGAQFGTADGTDAAVMSSDNFLSWLQAAVVLSQRMYVYENYAAAAMRWSAAVEGYWRQLKRPTRGLFNCQAWVMTNTQHTTHKRNCWHEVSAPLSMGFEILCSNLYVSFASNQPTPQVGMVQAPLLFQ